MMSGINPDGGPSFITGTDIVLDGGLSAM